MKRLFCIALSFFLILSLCGCAVPIDLTGEDAADRILEISEAPEEYLGKIIRVTGYYTYEESFGTRYHYVLLNRSQEEENIGFEIRWQGEYPESGTEITVTGELESSVEYGQAYIYLVLSELESAE